MIRNIDHTNLSYIEPHRVIQKAVNHLFNYSGMDLRRFKEEYNPEFKKKSFIDKIKQPIISFKKKENNYDDNIKNNYEDDEININKTDNEKDDGLSL